MPKILNEKTISKSISLFEQQIDRINLHTQKYGGTLTDFVRTAVQEKLDKLDGIEEDETNILGLNGAKEDSLLVPAKIYQEWFGLGNSAFSHRKRNNKIRVHEGGGRQWVEIEQKEAGFIMKFLTYENRTRGEISSLNDMLQEYMERSNAFDAAIRDLRKRDKELSAQISELKEKNELEKTK